jgi:hypothetical protein
VLKRLAALCVLVPALMYAIGAETNRPPGGRMNFGLVTLDPSSRSLSFPAVVNMREQMVEYVVVHKTGKTHESILRTDARPQDLHTAMLLLGTRGGLTNQWGEDGKGPPEGDAIHVEITWTNEGAIVRRPLEDIVLLKEADGPPTRGVWIYNGSNFSEGQFSAQRDGSIISLHIDPDALINNPRPERENDDAHRPNTNLLPAQGRPVTIIVRAARTPAAHRDAPQRK